MRGGCKGAGKQTSFSDFEVAMKTEGLGVSDFGCRQECPQENNHPVSVPTNVTQTWPKQHGLLYPITPQIGTL